MQATAKSLAEHLLPKSHAYYEIWLDEEQVANSGAEDEPLYGATYLPRKFKIAFAIPPDNDVDVFANDLGFIAIIEDGNVRGYNVVVGGGMGATHGDAETYPRLASMLGFIDAQNVVAVTEAVLTAQRDFGNRTNRARARLKYTIDDRGIDWFKNEVHRRARLSFAPALPFSFDHNGDRFGWRRGEDGREHLTLRIEAGRIMDRGQTTHLTGLREIAAVNRGEFRLTPNQNLVIAGIESAQRDQIEALVAAHGLDGYRKAAPLRLRALACVAMPTCALAMAEAERYLPELLAKLEDMLDCHDLREVPISLRVSGCPNGCSRPYLGEIALVGKAPGRYNLMLGGNASGQRLNTLYRENIDESEILQCLAPLLARYAAKRNPDEGFGDFLIRSGIATSAKPRLQRISMETTT